MEYFYLSPETGYKIPLSLKRGAPEWVNYDCPVIYRADGWRVLITDMTGPYYQLEDLPEFELLLQFVAMSQRAFNKKYPQCAGEGIFRKFLKVNVDMMAELAEKVYIKAIKLAEKET
jgi:hypothetical protein